MSEVIILKNGKREHITFARDFADILDKELGMDARNYFLEIVEESNDMEESLKEILRRTCDELFDIRQVIEKQIENDQVDKDVLSKIAKQINELEYDLCPSM